MNASLDTGCSGEWRVVVVDDSEDERLEAKRLLLRGADRRYRFSDAETGAAGVRAVLDGSSGPPACLLLDYKLPDMEAPEVIAALKDSDGLPLCPIVVLTVHIGAQLGREVLRAGAHDYIGKEWLTPQALTRAVENAVERWQLSKELRERETALEASHAKNQALYDVMRESEARLRLALEATHTGIWTWHLKSDEVSWTPECYVIHGMEEGRFEGTGAAFFQLVHPEDRARVETSVRAAIAGRSLYRCEFRVRRPDGADVWVENLGRANYDDRGEPVRMLGTLTDVSQRKRAEENLLRSEERFARAQRAAGVGTWDWNLVTGEAIWTEQAWRLFGKSPSSDPVTYDLWLSSIHPEDRERAASATQAALESGPYQDKFRVLHADGTVRWVEAAGESVAGEDGRALRLLGTVRDVTERQEAEESLRDALGRAEEAVRSRDQLLSLVSHDLRTPMQAMAMILNILSTEGHATERAPQLLNRMSDQLARMSRLVRELLDAAQLHAGKPLDLDPQPTDLVQLVRASASEHQRNTPSHRIEIRSAVEVATGLWDPLRIEQVVNNLLSNAVKYSPRSEVVWVELETEEIEASTWMVLRVRDEGIGIPASDHVGIFEWFNRAENARSTNIPGTGIGLAAAYEIVRQHGGALSVASKEGEGSVFSVKLPAERRSPPSNR